MARFVYVMGGFEQQTGDTTSATERHDTEHGTWKRVADIPVGLNHAAAASDRGRMYVLGGYRGQTGLDEETSARHRYDPNTRATTEQVRGASIEGREPGWDT